MSEEEPRDWGIYGGIGAVLGAVSLFLGGLVGMLVAAAAVISGVVANRKQQGLWSIGVVLGCGVLIVGNLFNMGILSSPTKSSMKHYIHSIQGSIRASEVLGGAADKPMSEEDLQKLLNLTQFTIKEAKQVDTALINEQIPGFQEHYQEEFIRGMELLARGYQTDNVGTKLKGAVLLDKWGLWSRPKNAELKAAMETAPSVADLLKFFK